jgi:hypothetical protein
VTADAGLPSPPRRHMLRTPNGMGSVRLSTLAVDPCNPTYRLQTTPLFQALVRPGGDHGELRLGIEVEHGNPCVKTIRRDTDGCRCTGPWHRPATRSRKVLVLGSQLGVSITPGSTGGGAGAGPRRPVSSSSKRGSKA